MAKNYRKLPILSPQDIQRFWSKVNTVPGQGPKGSCWEWTGARLKGRNPYGWFGVTRSQPYYAHRIAYFIYYLNDPGTLQVCHSCDNKACCHPFHLWKGDNGANQRDYFSKGFQRDTLAMGQTHHLTHLTDDDIKILRAVDYRPRGTVIKMANQYGIDRHTLLAIRDRRTWKHI